MKTQELARYVQDRLDQLDFNGPQLNFPDGHSKELREKVMYLTPTDARVGLSKSTVWNLRKRVQSYRPLHIYGKTPYRIGRCES